MSRHQPPIRSPSGADSSGNEGLRQAGGRGQVEHGPIPFLDRSLRRDIRHERPQFLVAHRRKIGRKPEVAAVDASGHPIHNSGALPERDRHRGAGRIRANSWEPEETLQRVGNRTELNDGPRQEPEASSLDLPVREGESLTRSSRPSHERDARHLAIGRTSARRPSLPLPLATAGEEPPRPGCGTGHRFRATGRTAGSALPTATTFCGNGPDRRPHGCQSHASGSSSPRVEEGCLGDRRANLVDVQTGGGVRRSIELADVGLLPEEYEEQVRSFGYDLVRIAELIAAGP